MHKRQISKESQSVPANHKSENRNPNRNIADFREPPKALLATSMSNPAVQRKIDYKGTIIKPETMHFINEVQKRDPRLEPPELKDITPEMVNALAELTENPFIFKYDSENGFELAHPEDSHLDLKRRQGLAQINHLVAGVNLNGLFDFVAHMDMHRLQEQEKFKIPTNIDPVSAVYHYSGDDHGKAQHKEIGSLLPKEVKYAGLGHGERWFRDQFYQTYGLNEEGKPQFLGAPHLDEISKDQMAEVEEKKKNSLFGGGQDTMNPALKAGLTSVEGMSVKKMDRDLYLHQGKMANSQRPERIKNFASYGNFMGVPETQVHGSRSLIFGADTNKWEHEGNPVFGPGKEQLESTQLNPENRIAIDTSWLRVGHADEVVSIIPWKDEDGFKVAMAKAVNSGKEDGEKVAATVNEKIKKVEGQILKKRPDLADKIIHFPVMFEPIEGDFGGAVYKVIGSNPVNLMSIPTYESGTTLIIPTHPDNPHEEQIRETLHGSGNTVHFVDAEADNSLSGNLHCKTNEVRAVHSAHLLEADTRIDDSKKCVVHEEAQPEFGHQTFEV
ncbi:hypothetical protein KFE98_10375 [bacterium SCSIO 12741]|nr:hypothetical protein KFE98_10375 [bacterium SCSIO 12741]